MEIDRSDVALTGGAVAGAVSLPVVLSSAVADSVHVLIAFYIGYAVAWFAILGIAGVRPFSTIADLITQPRHVPLVVPDICRLLEDPFVDWEGVGQQLRSQSSGVTVAMDGGAIFTPVEVQCHGRAARMLRRSIDVAQQNLLRRATGELPPPSDLRLLLETKGT